MVVSWWMVAFLPSEVQLALKQDTTVPNRPLFASTTFINVENWVALFIPVDEFI